MWMIAGALRTYVRARHRSVLVDAEVLGDAMHVQKPADEERHSDEADECQCARDEKQEPVEAGARRPTSSPRGFSEHERGFGAIYASDITLTHRRSGG